MTSASTQQTLERALSDAVAASYAANERQSRHDPEKEAVEAAVQEALRLAAQQSPGASQDELLRIVVQHFCHEKSAATISSEKSAA